MSLELTSKVVQTPKTSYDQVTSETVVSTPDLTSTDTHGKKDRMDRNLVSESSRKGPKITTRESDPAKTTKLAETSTSHSTKTEKVNLGFHLSFSIPLHGIIPTGNNC